MRFSSEHGQSTVEAAFLLPVLFTVFGLLLQPSILLYNRCIMNAAAAEGCRLIATNTNDRASTQAFFERRLSAIPKIPIFHEGDTWELSWSGGELGQPASVTIVNHAQPLPLFGIVAGLSDSVDTEGRIKQKVEVAGALAPTWASSLGSGPADWIKSWK